MQQKEMRYCQIMRNSRFDIIKGVACIAVVLIHYTFPGFFGDWVKVFCRFAVPFFFCVSGYYLFDFNSDKVDAESIVRKIKKLTSILVWSTIFYGFVYYFAVHCPKGGLSIASYIERYINAKTLLYMFLCNTGLFNLALWFIGALIYCYITVLLVFNTKKRLYFSWVLILPLLGVMSITQEFAGVAGFKWNLIPISGVKPIPYFQLSCCFLCRALPFFLLGTVLRAFSKIIKEWKIPDWIFLFGAFVSGVISILEFKLLNGRVAQFYIGSYLMALSLCLWAIRGGGSDKFIKLAWIGRELSMLVYILHIAVGIGVSRLVKGIGVALAWYGWINPIIVIVMSIGLSFVIYKLGRLIKNM